MKEVWTVMKKTHVDFEMNNTGLIVDPIPLYGSLS